MSTLKLSPKRRCNSPIRTVRPYNKLGLLFPSSDYQKKLQRGSDQERAESCRAEGSSHLAALAVPRTTPADPRRGHGAAALSRGHSGSR